MCCLFNYISKTKMDDFRRFLNKQLEDPDFRKEWEETKLEYQIMKAMIAARIEAGITQATFKGNTYQLVKSQQN